MKRLLIEWKHYDKGGNTCIRCSKTGVAVHKAVEELKNSLSRKGISISYKETKLSEEKIQASNSILLNGILLEDLLNDTKKVETACSSCCGLIGSDVSCRALDCHGQIREDVPVRLIKKAVINLLRKEGQ